LDSISEEAVFNDAVFLQNYVYNVYNGVKPPWSPGSGGYETADRMLRLTSLRPMTGPQASANIYKGLFLPIMLPILPIFGMKNTVISEKLISSLKKQQTPLSALIN
jgi:hypothetical protein